MNWNRTVGVLALALLVVVAGCSGGGGSGGEATTTAPDVEQSATDAATESTQTAAPTTEETATPAETTSGSSSDAGDPEVRQFVQAGTSQLAESDGLVVRVESTTARGQQSVTTNGTLRWDGTNGALFASVQTSGPMSVNVEQYQPPGSDTVYQCLVGNGSCQRRQEQPASAIGVQPATLLGNVFDEQQFGLFEKTGSVSTDVGQLERYVLEGVDNVPASLSAREGNFTTYRVELFFDPQTGTLRKAHAETVLETEQGTDSSDLTVTYTKIGPVTIEAPDWYDEESD